MSHIILVQYAVFITYNCLRLFFASPSGKLDVVLFLGTLCLQRMGKLGYVSYESSVSLLYGLTIAA